MAWQRSIDGAVDVRPAALLTGGIRDAQQAPSIVERSRPSQGATQRAQNSRGEGRPEDEIPGQEAIQSMKYGPDVNVLKNTQRQVPRG